MQTTSDWTNHNLVKVLLWHSVNVIPTGGDEMNASLVKEHQNLSQQIDQTNSGKIADAIFDFV
jgi:hypothetical protein